MSSNISTHNANALDVQQQWQQQHYQQQPQQQHTVKIPASLYTRSNHNNHNNNNSNNNTLPLFAPASIDRNNWPSWATTTSTTTTSNNNNNSTSYFSTDRILNRVRGWRVSFRSPRAVIAGGCLELFALLYFFSRLNILEGEYFRLGPPVILFQYEVTESFDFYMILSVFFFHQVTYTWITETLNPWLLNEVQDQKCETIRYSKPVTLSVINLYTAYLTLNNILVLNIAFSQVSFLIVVLLADVVSTTLLNLSYIWHKTTIACDDDESDQQNNNNNTNDNNDGHDDDIKKIKNKAKGDYYFDEEAQVLLLKGYNTIPTTSTTTIPATANATTSATTAAAPSLATAITTSMSSTTTTMTTSASSSMSQTSTLSTSTTALPVVIVAATRPV